MEKLTDRIYRQHRKRQQRFSFRVHLTQILILAAFLGSWEWVGRRGWIDVLLFSYPSKVLTLLFKMWREGTLLTNTGVTVTETIAGFILGTLVGTLIATAIWWSPFLSRVLDPYMVVGNSMPKVALGPLFIVGLGPGLFSIIAMTLAVTVIITALVIYGSFREVDPNLLRLVRIYGGGKRQQFEKVILPASVPAIMSALKVNVGLAWIGVIVGEFLVAKQGLGYLIIYGFQVFNFTLVIGSLFVVAAVATAMYQLVAVLESRFVRSGHR